MSANRVPQISLGKTLLSGLRCRCPRCSVGGLFYSYLKIVDECPECHLNLQGHDTGDATAVPATLVLGSVVVGLALYFELTYEPPMWAHLVLWPPVITGLTLVILPPLKGLSVALQYRFRSTDEEGRPGGS